MYASIELKSTESKPIVDNSFNTTVLTPNSISMSNTIKNIIYFQLIYALIFDELLIRNRLQKIMSYLFFPLTELRLEAVILIFDGMFLEMS